MTDLSPVLILGVSLPEAVASLIIMILLLGQRKYLNWRDKSNIIRFVGSICLMLLATVVVLPLSPNVVTNAAGHFIFYLLIIKLVYSIDFPAALFSVSLFYTLAMVVENTYMPFVITYVFKSPANFYSDSVNLLIYSIPARVMQIIIIVFLLKYHIVFISTKLNKKINILVSVVLAGIMFSELFISLAFVNNFDKFSQASQILFSVSLAALMLFNMLIIKIVFEVTKWAVEAGSNQYYSLENHSEWLFNKIRTLLEENNIDGAKKILSRLNGSD
jgi:hypothetical protein